MRRLAALAALCLVATACGSSAVPSRHGSRVVDLPGWRPVADEPGIGELAPDLSGLDVVRRTDSPALVRNGDAIRATTFTFASTADAVAVVSRAKSSPFLADLDRELHGRVDAMAAGRAVGYRIAVSRPAEPGRDTIELYLLRRGRTVVLVELVSAAGFGLPLRDEILAAVRR